MQDLGSRDAVGLWSCNTRSPTLVNWHYTSFVIQYYRDVDGRILVTGRPTNIRVI
jgi:hypothetical protein